MTKDDFTREFCEELIRENGSITKAAQMYTGVVRNPFDPTRAVSWRTIERWIARALRDSPNVDRSSVAVLGGSRVTRETQGTYEALARVDGVPTVFNLKRSTITMVPDVPPFPVLERSPLAPIVYNQAPYVSRPIRYGVVVSDVQYGFLRDGVSGELEAIHDPKALAVARHITGDIRPNDLYFIGDFCDWPTFSRWQKFPEYYGTMQASIDGAYRELGEIIAAAGHQCERRIMVGSNHQQRPEKFLLDYNMEALSVRRAATPPTGWPVFSEQYLLRYDDLGIQFSGQYPGGQHYVLPDLVLSHGPLNKLEFAASVVHGHTHKLTVDTWAQHSFSGRRNYYQYDVGCLCQLGSTTNLQRLHITRVPSDRARTDWSQGMAVISIIDGKIPKHAVDLIKIDRGTAIYQGQAYDAN
jgi:hypothetical protein